jgi:hypothetical protein
VAELAEKVAKTSSQERNDEGQPTSRDGTPRVRNYGLKVVGGIGTLRTDASNILLLCGRKSCWRAARRHLLSLGGRKSMRNS